MMHTSRSGKTPGRPPQPGEGGKNVREAFLDTALELFGCRGVAATSVAEIAAAVGVSPAMAQYYFKNREQLLDAVVSERILPLIDFVWGGFDAALEEKALVPLLQRLIERLLQLSAQKPWLPNLWVSEVLSRSGQLRKRILPYVHETYLRRFANTFEAAQGQGLINPDLMPRLTLGSVMGSAMIPLVFLDAGEGAVLDAAGQERVTRHALSLILPGLAPDGRVPVRPRRHGG